MAESGPALTEQDRRHPSLMPQLGKPPCVTASPLSLDHEQAAVGRALTPCRRTQRVKEPTWPSVASCRQLLKLVPAVLCVLAPDGTTIATNAAVTKITGYRPEQLRGKNWWDIFYPDEQRRQAVDFFSHVQSGDVSDYAMSLIASDGLPRTLVWNTSNEYRQDGSLARIIALGMETAGHPQTAKLTKRLLEESEKRFRSVVQTASDAIILVDGRRRLVFWNSAAQDMYGYSADEAIGRPLEFVVPERFRQHFRNGLNAALSSASTGEVEKRINVTGLRKDGREFPAELSFASWKTSDGVFFTGTIRDITDRKQAEQNLKQSFERLRKTFEGTINAMAVAVDLKDPYTAGHQRRVAKLATAIAKRMGLTEEQLDAVQLGGIIHDIGKINIPVEILSKPGRLSPVEFTLIKGHSQTGYDILRTVDFPWPIAEIVLQHHERVNGSGYPSSLSGDALLLESMIIAVADVVEAMTFHRPYRAAPGIALALAEIARNRGLLYHPDVVDACIRVFRRAGFDWS